jgi:hypothetical protein
MYLNFNHRFAMLFAWVLFIIVLLLSPMPFNDAPESVTFIDKIIHAFLFGILTFLTFYLLTDEKVEAIINPERTIQKKKKNKIYKKDLYTNQ